MIDGAECLLEGVAQSRPIANTRSASAMLTTNTIEAFANGFDRGQGCQGCDSTAALT